MIFIQDFKPTYLYIKQHRITGKLYFGKTDKNPEKYKGSGKYWLDHCKTHGFDIDTLWYCLFYTSEDISKFAADFCKINNIGYGDVSIWANLRPENGFDGAPNGFKLSESHKRHLSESKLGKPNVKIRGENHYSFGVTMSDDRRTKCANCGRNNGRAITVKATDIEGNEYTVNGTMRQFTSEHNL